MQIRQAWSQSLFSQFLSRHFSLATKARKRSQKKKYEKIFCVSLVFFCGKKQFGRMQYETTLPNMLGLPIENETVGDCCQELRFITLLAFPVTQATSHTS
jgi:hypothetical protein